MQAKAKANAHDTAKAVGAVGKMKCYNITKRNQDTDNTASEKATADAHTAHTGAANKIG